MDNKQTTENSRPTESAKRWGVLYCPRRGRRQQAKLWRRVERSLKDNGVDFDFVQSESEAGVSRLVTMLVDNGYTTIIIVGGDTALNNAVNSLMAVDRQKRDSIAIGIIPNGLMNDFARFWGFDEDNVEQTVGWLARRRVRRIDVGCVSYADDDGEQHKCHFVNCVNIGLIAAIMDLRGRTRRALGSRTLSMIVSFVLMIFQRLEYKMRLKINNSELKRKVMTVCVGSAPGYGQTPSAVPYNGMLDVSVVYTPPLTQLVEGFYLLLKGKILNHRSVHPYRTTEVEICEARHTPLAIDGRPAGEAECPVRITVMQEEINFLIPE